MRFGQDMEGRNARLWFSDGEVIVGRIIDVASPEDGDGFVFDVVSMNEIQTEPASKNALWETFDHLVRYEPLES